MTVAAVLFDWGGTLTPFHDADLVDLWRLVAVTIAPEHVTEITWRLVAAERAWWAAATGGEGLDGVAPAAGARHGTLLDVMSAGSAELGVDVAAALARARAMADLTHWTPHTVADPEGLLVIHLLRARGVRAGLVTNTRWPRAWHEQLLARDCLLNLLDARVYTNELAASKPHPAGYEAALAALGIDDPASVVFVGDRPFTDLSGAQACGMRTVLLADGEPPGTEPAAPTARPDAVITRLGQLLPVLDRFEAAARNPA
ncbi:MAG: HAD family hydrolase [Frankia sp.]|nr:HAD family hydrolase [Frankia sp.]